MAKPKTVTQRPQKLSDRPLVMVAGEGSFALSKDLVTILLEESAKRGWRVMEVKLTAGSTTDQRPAGAIVGWLPDDPQTVRLRELGCPVVRIGRLPHRDDGDVPAVLPNFRDAGRLAADFFAERGFRDIATIGQEDMAVAEPIDAGLTDRAAVLRCACHSFRFKRRDRRQATETRAALRDERARVLAAWLPSRPKPLAMLAYSDAIAASVSIMCQSAGLAVPEDVAVMAIGNDDITCELAPVPITSIDMNRAEMVRQAVAQLGRLMRGENAPAQTLVSPSRVVARRSTDILAVADPTVARAVRYIWDNLERDPSVDDVAQAVQTPRYKLEKLFRRHLDRGINEELQRFRLERFCELLRSTDQTVGELAPQVGFNSARYLHRAFRKRHGMTPREYRLAARADRSHTRPSS